MRLEAHLKSKEENSVPGPGHYKNSGKELKNKYKGITMGKLITRDREKLKSDIV